LFWGIGLLDEYVLIAYTMGLEFGHEYPKWCFVWLMTMGDHGRMSVMQASACSNHTCILLF
jgi:hypothetical protein